MNKKGNPMLRYEKVIEENLTSLGIDFFSFYRNSSKTSKYYMLNKLKSSMVKWELYFADGILNFSYGLIDSLESKRYFNEKMYLICKGVVDWDFIKKKAEESREIDSQLVSFLEIK